MVGLEFHMEMKMKNGVVDFCAERELYVANKYFMEKYIYNYTMGWMAVEMG